MKKPFVFLALCLLFLVCISAVSLEHKIDREIIIKEYPSSLYLNISISGLNEGNYNIYTLSDVYLKPDGFFYVEEENSSLNLDFEVVPMERLLDFEGSYILSYFLNDRDRNEKYNKKIALELLSIADIIEIDSEIINLSDNSVVLSVKNKENVEIKNVHVRFKSVLFDSESNFDLKPNETHRLEIPISNEELKRIQSGSYLMDVIFMTPRGDVKTESQIHLIEKKGVMTRENSSGFLFRTTRVSVINIGNTIEDARIEIRKNVLNKYYTYFDKEPVTSYREGSDVFYVWSKKLTPLESYNVLATTNNFFPFLIIAVIVVVVLGILRYFRTKIILEKSVTEIKTKTGEFALRVNLSVRAKSNVNEVVLIDKVPNIVKIYKKGMVLPDEIDVATRRLKWNLGEMKRGEKREFSYIVYSRVNYLGRFSLPPALSQFKFRSKIIQVISNSVFFISEPRTKEYE